MVCLEFISEKFERSQKVLVESKVGLESIDMPLVAKIRTTKKKIR